MICGIRAVTLTSVISLSRYYLPGELSKTTTLSVHCFLGACWHQRRCTQNWIHPNASGRYLRNRHCLCSKDYVRIGSWRIHTGTANIHPVATTTLGMQYEQYCSINRRFSSSVPLSTIVNKCAVVWTSQRNFIWMTCHSLMNVTRAVSTWVHAYRSSWELQNSRVTTFGNLKLREDWRHVRIAFARK